MRVLVAALGHESNTFTPFLTTLDDFVVRSGAEALADLGDRDAYAGIVRTLRAQGVDLVPPIVARAMPGGVVERAAYERFKRTILDQAHDVDGACLFLHGAMRAQGCDYCENDLLAELRARLGPCVPIAVAMDMHANIVVDMVCNVDAIVAYHTAPHVDRYETGEKAARILLRVLRGGVQARMGYAKLPFLLPGEMAQTALEPMASIMRAVAEVEARPGVLSASVVNAHCWADVPDIGVATLVVTDGDAALAQREADRLAATFWEWRAQFSVSAEAYPVDEAIEAALAAAARPTCRSSCAACSSGGRRTSWSPRSGTPKRFGAAWRPGWGTRCASRWAASWTPRTAARCR